MPTPYENKEYVDWILDISTDTEVNGSGDRVTPPRKIKIRDMSLTIDGTLDGASVIAQFSPDEMETPEANIDPETMKWFERDDGTFTGADPFTLWENMDVSEGWIRIVVRGATINTDIEVKTRPRVEKRI